MSPLLLERLEDRCVPVTWGNPWPDALHLSLSFAPDGTTAGSYSSNLQATLDAQASRDVWQREVLRAFQTWAMHANINIALVPDGGQALGSAGRPQGDSRFGDIRIAGYAMPSDVLAIATPFEATAGTWSGDVKVNTGMNFTVGSGAGIDLFSALLHEAGHVFGLDHSAESESPLYATYQGVRLGLDDSDIAHLQALYGSRGPDAFEGSAGNGTLSSATRLNLLANPDGTLGVAAAGDLGSLSDRDVYRFQTPLTPGPLVIQLKTAGISLLTSRLTVYDSSGRVVGSATATDPLANDLTVHINSPRLLSTYYVKVEGANGDAFSVGSYRLEVRSLPLLQTVTSTVGAVVDATKQLLSDDLHTDDTFLTAGLLPPLTTSVDSRFDYAFRASIRDTWDVDLYRITAPTGTDADTVLTVLAWGLDNDGLKPRVSVFDAQGNAVASEVLVNADGIFNIQVRNTVAGAAYFVKIEAADPNGANGTGNYFLGVDFARQAVQLETFASLTLTASQPVRQGFLNIAQSEMLHLVLGAEGGNAVIRMTIRDLQGRTIAVVDSTSNRDPASLTQPLPAGLYVVRFEVFDSNGTPLTNVRLTLKGTRLSDPIGPKPEDSTTSPSGSTSTSSGSTTTTQPPPPPPSGSTSSTSSGSTTTQPPPPPPPSSEQQPPPSSPPPSEPPPSQPPPPPPESQYYEYYYWDGYQYYYYGSYSSEYEGQYSDPYSSGG